MLPAETSFFSSSESSTLEHMFRFLIKHKQVLLYAASLGGLLLLLPLLQYKLLLLNHSLELYLLSIALLFTGLGGWLALQLSTPRTHLKTVLVPTPVPHEPDAGWVENRRRELGLSSRELEVLQLMARGLSNQEIADTLFLSLATVKTHSSRLFEKLDVKRRTQAVEKARQQKLIA